MFFALTLSNSDYLDRLKEYNIKAIIVGLDQFSDRFKRYYSLKELREIINKADSLGIKTYVSLNTIIHEFDLPKLYKYLDELRTLNIARIYFNDLAILEYARSNNCCELFSYNPDTLLSNSRDLEFFLKQNLASCVIAKELRLDEIKAIKSKLASFKLDMIIHAKINLAYSKRMFLDNYYRFINKEKDLSYQNDLKIIEENREYAMPIYQSRYGTSVFSDYTFNILNEFKELNDLIDCGIIDDLFLDEKELFDSLKALNGEYKLEDLKQLYPLSMYDSGFLYEYVDILKKEDNNGKN